MAKQAAFQEMMEKSSSLFNMLSTGVAAAQIARMAAKNPAVRSAVSSGVNKIKSSNVFGNLMKNENVIRATQKMREVGDSAKGLLNTKVT